MKNFNQELIEDKLKNYIWNKLFVTAKEKLFLSNILKLTDILVFGGVIREFVLNNLKQIDHRDVDLVVVNLNEEIETYLNPYLIRKNSFGGFKLKVNAKDIDLWKLGETWGIRNKAPLFTDATEFLPETSFFNLNAVAFSISNNKLHYSEGFENFVNTRILDIEFTPNPLPSLCLLKTFEYTKKYKLDIAPKLVKYLVTNFNEKKTNEISNQQVKHYGNILYSQKEILEFYDKLKKKNSEQLSFPSVY
ncbi:MAG: hypothetical protein ACYDEE_01685 [Ignavibacteriaceae bacterium]